jgi:hypothetical protein
MSNIKFKDYVNSLENKVDGLSKDDKLILHDNIQGNIKGITIEQLLSIGEVEISKTLFVSKSGNDSSAQKGLLNKPFLTITAARDASQEGDLIVVYPGTYNDFGILKNMVNYYLYSGVTLNGGGIYCNENNLNCKVLGYGHFESTNSIYLLGDNNNIYIECDSVHGGDSASRFQSLTNSNINIFVRGLMSSNGSAVVNVRNTTILNSEIYVRCHEMRSTFTSGVFHSIYTNGIDYHKLTVVVDTNIYSGESTNNNPTIMIVSPHVEFELNCRTIIDMRDNVTSVHNRCIDVRGGKSKIRCNIICNDLDGIGLSYSGGNVILDFEGEVLSLKRRAVRLVRPGNTFNLKGIFISSSSSVISNESSNNIINIQGELINNSETGYGIYNNQITGQFSLDNAIIKTQGASIFSTQPINVKVIKDFYYNTVHNNNVTLVTEYIKYPSSGGDTSNLVSIQSFEQHSNDEGIHVTLADKERWDANNEPQQLLSTGVSEEEFDDHKNDNTIHLTSDQILALIDKSDRVLFSETAPDTTNLEHGKSVWWNTLTNRRYDLLKQGDRKIWVQPNPFTF